MNKMYKILATASLLFGILGITLPYIAIYFQISSAFAFEAKYSLVDPNYVPDNSEINKIYTYVSIGLILFNPMAIASGFLSLKKHSEDNSSKLWKFSATTGIILGVISLVILISLFLFAWALFIFFGGYVT